MKQIFNELPRPTFRWMRVNHQELETPEVKLVPEAAVEERHEGSAEVTFFTGRRVPNLEDFAGASQESMKDALEKGNVNCEISVKDGEKAKVWLDYSLSETVSALVGQLYIKAGKNSDVEVFTTFEGDAPDGLVNVLFYVEAGENANVNVSKVQIHGSHVRHIDQRYTHDGKGSKVKFVSAEVGGKETLVYVRTDLDHDESDFKSQTMYLGSENQLFDFPIGFRPKESRPIRTFSRRELSWEPAANISAARSIFCEAARKLWATKKIHVCSLIRASIPFPFRCFFARKMMSLATTPQVPAR